MLIKDAAPRNEWPLGRVVEVIKSGDQLVWKARVEVGSRELNGKGQRTGKLSALKRPVQKLVLLLEAGGQTI